MNNTIYIFAWGNTPKRAALKGRACKILNDEVLNNSLAAMQAEIIILTRICEVVFVDTGQREFVSHQALRAIKCQTCRQPLIEIDFNRQYCIRLCNNHKCLVYAEKQGLRERSDEEGKSYMLRRKAKIYTPTSSMGGNRRSKEATPEQASQRELRKARPDYEPWLERKKHYYHKLRGLGYSSKEAMANSTTKRMKGLGINV